jgi:hypothetical protein
VKLFWGPCDLFHTRRRPRPSRYPSAYFMERAEATVFAPSTARSHFEGKAMDDPPIFEETYPKYEFSVLVRMAMALGAWISGIRRRSRTSRRWPWRSRRSAGLASIPKNATHSRRDWRTSRHRI